MSFCIPQGYAKRDLQGLLEAPPLKRSWIRENDRDVKDYKGCRDRVLPQNREERKEKEWDIKMCIKKRKRAESRE